MPCKGRDFCLAIPIARKTISAVIKRVSLFFLGGAGGANFCIFGFPLALPGCSLRFSRASDSSTEAEIDDDEEGDEASSKSSESGGAFHCHLLMSSSSLTPSSSSSDDSFSPEDQQSTSMLFIFVFVFVSFWIKAAFVFAFAVAAGAGQCTSDVSVRAHCIAVSSLESCLAASWHLESVNLHSRNRSARATFWLPPLSSRTAGSSKKTGELSPDPCYDE
eukprot:CAMPEP_0206521096 /NCGR_PEP_ID=MMETSP0324_2-20121206/66136_1 /ASSEMBLY_ACC=CAM_ASM_000836 /TAXON_ID=2866 /ORGANISM="Crypthecodinium cohnii, Strain Seligo" /LENGTH=218 /DNA_ID=CAMNT_0054014909 /DNA_START=198 /DNA_END=855 /DNA_ORIENTATION=+